MQSHILQIRALLGVCMKGVFNANSLRWSFGLKAFGPNRFRLDDERFAIRVKLV